MAANTKPIYTLVPSSGSEQLTTGNNRSDGNGTIGTDMFKIFEASASGGYVSSVRFAPWATVAGTATAATVARLYISGSTSGATTSANTFLIGEYALAAQTADSATVATYIVEAQINKAIKGGFTILASIHTTPSANTGWSATCFGGNYE